MVALRKFISVVIAWGLMLQPALALRLDPACCDRDERTADVSSCCAQIAEIVCGEPVAEPACDSGCCTESEPKSTDCDTCSAVCKLVCGTNTEPTTTTSSTVFVAAIDLGVVVSTPMTLPAPIWREAVPMSVNEHPPTTSERLSTLCVRTT